MVAEGYRARERLFADVIMAAQTLKSRLRFYKDTLSCAVKECRSQCSPHAGAMLDAYCAAIDSGVAEAGGALEDCLPELTLSARERAALCAFLQGLGRSDAHGQHEHLTACELTFRDFLQESAAQRRRFASMYVKLGFSAGLLLVILLV